MFVKKQLLQINLITFLAHFFIQCNFSKTNFSKANFSNFVVLPFTASINSKFYKILQMFLDGAGLLVFYPTEGRNKYVSLPWSVRFLGLVYLVKGEVIWHL